MKRYVKSSKISELEAKKAELESKIARVRKQESEQAVVDRIETEVNKLYQPQTGLSIVVDKFKFIDDTHIVIAWRLPDIVSIYWYRNPGRIKLTSKFVISTDYSSEELQQYVDVLVERTPDQLVRSLDWVHNLSRIINEVAQNDGEVPLEINTELTVDNVISYAVNDKFARSIVNESTFVRILKYAIQHSNLLEKLNNEVIRYNKRVRECIQIYDAVVGEDYRYPLIDFYIKQIDLAQYDGSNLDSATYVFKFDVDTNNTWWAKNSWSNKFFFGDSVDSALSTISRDVEEQFSHIDHYLKQE